MSAETQTAGGFYPACCGVPLNFVAGDIQIRRSRIRKNAGFGSPPAFLRMRLRNPAEALAGRGFDGATERAEFPPVVTCLMEAVDLLQLQLGDFLGTGPD